MIISHKHKFIFVHVPKTAGTSIVQTLYPYLDLNQDIIYGGHRDHEKKNDEQRKADGKLHKHSTAQEIKEYVGEEVWDSYLTCGAVRNPYSRVVSVYNWWHGTKYENENKKKIINLSFSDFCKSDYTGYPQVNFLCYQDEQKKDLPSTCKNKLLVDCLMSYEGINSYFSYICGLLKLPKLELKTKNVSTCRDDKNIYQDYYDRPAYEAVTEKYREDLDKFSYKYFVPKGSNARSFP